MPDVSTVKIMYNQFKTPKIFKKKTEIFERYVVSTKINDTNM